MPTAHRQKIRHATVRDFSARYLKEVVEKDRKDPQPIRRYLDREILPRLGSRRVDRVSGGDVQRIVFARRDAGHPAAARAIRGVVKRFWDYAIVCGVAEDNPAAGAPTRYLGKLRSRDRVLSESELTRVLRVLRSDTSPSHTALELLLLLQVRKGELRLARWEEFRLDRQEWEIPAERTKTDKAQIVYLSRQAVALLRRLKEGQRPEVERVLPMHNSWLEPASPAWLNQRSLIVEKRAGVKHFTVHDLRRTAATHLTEMGWKPEVVEKALGHAIKGVRGIYNRAEFADERRQMVQAWADWLGSLVR